MSATSKSTKTPATDPRQEQADRHLQILQELAEIGTTIAQTVRRRALEQAAISAADGVAFASRDWLVARLNSGAAQCQAEIDRTMSDIEAIQRRIGGRVPQDLLLARGGNC